MLCSEDLSPQLKTILITLLSIISSMNLNVEDKVYVSRVLIYIGQLFSIEATLEAKAEEEKKATEEVLLLQKQIDSLTKQMENIKRYVHR